MSSVVQFTVPGVFIENFQGLNLSSTIVIRLNYQKKKRKKGKRKKKKKNTLAAWESGWADLDEKIIFYAHRNILKFKIRSKKLTPTMSTQFLCTADSQKKSSYALLVLCLTCNA